MTHRLDHPTMHRTTIRSTYQRSLLGGMDRRRAHRIAIVGCGPRGVYALSALAGELRRRPGLACHIVLFDPKFSAGGQTYDVSQPDYLLMNTVAERLTAYRDHTIPDGPADGEGANLADWFRSNISETLAENSYLPRRMHGEYLIAARRSAIAQLPASATVEVVEDQVVDVRRDRARLAMLVRSGRWLDGFSSVLLTVGHGSTEDRPQAAAKAACTGTPLPMGDWTDQIEAGETVGVVGLGLTAIDAILALTIGRGGRFEPQGTGLGYVPSGQEPQILAWSRSGVPLAAKAVNQKPPGARHIARFLTDDAIACLRQGAHAAGRDGKLDFHEEVLPLISKEISLSACLSSFHRALPDPRTDGAQVLRDLFPLLPDRTRLDWQSLEASSLIHAPSHAEYCASLRHHLIEDVRAAEEGNVHNPAKCAADCLRDIRDQIRSVVDWFGLTPSSMRRFEAEFVPSYMRLAVGPPPLRIRQLLALWESGILDLGAGPDPVVTRLAPDRVAIRSRLPGGPQLEARRLISARVAPPLTGALAQALLRSGMGRAAENVLGEERYRYSALEVDRANRVVDATGQPVEGLHLYGSLCEGVTWYTFAAAHPLIASRALTDAVRWAKLELSRLAEEGSRVVSAAEPRRPVAVGGNRPPAVPAGVRRTHGIGACSP